MNKECEFYMEDWETGEPICMHHDFCKCTCDNCKLTKEEITQTRDKLKSADKHGDEIQRQVEISSLKKENAELKIKIANLEWEIEKLNNKIDDNEMKIGQFAVENSKYVKWSE